MRHSAGHSKKIGVLQRDVAVEEEAAAHGVEPQLVAAAERGGQSHGGHAGGHIHGIDGATAAVEDAEGVVGVTGLQGDDRTAAINIRK